MKKYTPHLGQASLVEACAQSGCPICGIGKKSVNAYLQMVMAAYVDAPDLRQQLCDSWGYCHNHAWMLSTVERGNLLTISIMYNDILEREAQKALARGSVKKKSGGLMQGLFKGKKLSQALQHLPLQRICPACELIVDIEANALKIMLKALVQKDNQMRDALRNSDGICFPHLNLAIELAQDQAVSEILLTLSKEKLAKIREELSEFIRKHDYRFQHEPIGEEKQGWKRALNLIVGPE